MWRLCWAGLMAALLPWFAHAQVVIDASLNGASSNYRWRSIGSACLTAGDGRGTVPSCFAAGRIGVPDPVGQGALRLTNSATNLGGGVISDFTFPSNQGLKVTFTTVTYGGNGYGGTGADGLSFFLIDASAMPTLDANTQLGAFGGALGYSSQRQVGGRGGILGGYLGVGIDEYGNFSNPRDNGSGGPGFVPNAVAIRGSASTGYRYISGTPLVGPIANSRATKRDAATPITFDLSISTDGLLDMRYSRDGGDPTPVITSLPISRDNGRLPAFFRFGFAASTGGGSNIHEITCFKAADSVAAASSAGSNVTESAKLQVGQQLYLTRYHSKNWWGQLTAQNLLLDPNLDTVSISKRATWDASCVLTGGVCEMTQGRGPAQAPADRLILSNTGSEPIALQWPSIVNTPLADLLAMPGSATPQQRLEYLRGDRRKEGLRGDDLRTRTSVLGDIMHSSPVWVGPPQGDYDDVWEDKLHPNSVAPEVNSYQSFADAQAARTHVVYVGANDGMLHGFRAGAYTRQGKFDPGVPNDGRELLAYMPLTALSAMRTSLVQLDFAGQHYAHNAYVDATAGVGDLYYAGAWHTWLVSGMGAGGNASGVLADNQAVGTGAVFALDITDPAAFQERNAGKLVLDEWRSNAFRCVGVDGKQCGRHLGNTFGTPLIRRLHDGNWAVIFGNGFHSASGKAGVFIVRVDATTGDRSLRFLDTGSGSVLRRNGIAEVTSIDLDDDDIVDFLYAGDLQGNVWRFDLTSADPAQWRVRGQPLFQTGGLPITTEVLVTPVAVAGNRARLMLNFGTGQIQPVTVSQGEVYDPRQQYLFGVWDWDMEAWNQRSLSRLASLSAASADLINGTVTSTQLQTQVISTEDTYSNGDISGVRRISNKLVCWAGSPGCVSNNRQFGWRARLPGALEQVVYSPVMRYGLVHVSTAIPPKRERMSCLPALPATGFTMVLTPDQGLAPPAAAKPELSYFAHATNFDPLYADVMGLGLGAVGKPSFIQVGNNTFMVTQLSDGSWNITQVNPPISPLRIKRHTRLQLR